MKKIFITLLYIFFANYMFSQHLERYVISSTGSYSISTIGSLSSTIGEPVISTLTSTSNVLTQGFQQSFTSIIDPSVTITNILDGEIFTNSNSLSINFDVADFSVSTGSADGHIHYYLNGTMMMKYDTMSIMLNNLVNGNYELIIQLVDNFHQPLSTNISDSVNFIINLSYGCTDSLSVNYDITADFDDGSCLYVGCTDATATNYDASAAVDDGSCIYPQACSYVMTGMFVDRIIDDRVWTNFDNMNTFDANGNELCRVDEMKIKYRQVGTTNPWRWKTMGSPTGYNANGFCNSTQLTEKELKLLDINTEYEWYFRIWYCDGGVSGWEQGPNFTTGPECPVVGNLTVDPFTNPNNGVSKATFTWDDSNGPFVFCRIKLRPEGITNPVASDWLNVGGGNVPYGTFSSIKYGLTAGQSYRAQAKGHCDPTGHPAYNSLTWTPLIFWTQPSLRMDGGTAIANLDIYPNPSRDVFNVTFTSEDVQDLEVRVVNIVGEVIYAEDLQQFVGEYTKSIDLATYTKAVYFLEITTNNGVVSKKLILQ